MVRAVVITIALVLGLASCGFGDGEERPPTPEPIPVGAQQVQIRLSPSREPRSPRLVTVELTPDTVRAGDVYLMIDDGYVSLLERKTAADASPGPLTDWQIARISRGASRCPRGLGPCSHAYVHRHPDVMKDTSATDIESGYCDPRNDPAARGTGGAIDGASAFCKVLRVNLRPGRYLIVSGAQPIDGSAVLVVTP